MSSVIAFKTSVMYFEVAAALVGLMTWLKWKRTHFKWTTFYLFIIAAIEISAYFLQKEKKFGAVSFLYNYISLPLQVSFICWLINKSLPQKYFRETIFLWLIYLLSFISEKVFFTGKEYIFSSLSYTVGNMIILVLVLIYFYQLIFSSNILTFKTNIMFWFSIGILTFYMGTFPYYGLYNYLAKTNINAFINYTWVTIFLNYILYSMFAIGFIWGRSK